MAESLSDSPDSATNDKSKAIESQVSREGFPPIPECAVCLQTCVHPARLPCNHIFCFLCLKGLATQGRRCAMCRQDIPADYLDHPDLLEYPTLFEKDPQAYKWFYEGRNGWWQYDERTCNELENAYKSGLRSCDLLIAGTLYVANFDGMVQLQKNDRSRWRRIKRDLSTVPKKGVAGLRIDVVLPPVVSPSSETPSGTSGTSGTVGETTSGDESSSLFLSENGPSTSFSTYRVQEEEDSDTSESEESEEDDEDDLEDVEREVDEEGYKGDSSETDSDTE